MFIKSSLVACLSFLFLANTAQSSDQEPPSVQAPSRQAYIDEATGELTSTPPAGSDLNRTAEATEQPKQQAIEYITHPDGTVEGKLNGHFQNELKVVLSCDGSLTTMHSDDGKQPNHDSLESCRESE